MMTPKREASLRGLASYDGPTVPLDALKDVLAELDSVRAENEKIVFAMEQTRLELIKRIEKLSEALSVVKNRGWTGLDISRRRCEELEDTLNQYGVDELQDMRSSPRKDSR